MFLQWRTKKELTFCLIMAFLLLVCPIASSLNDQGALSLSLFLFSFLKFLMVELACFVAQRSYRKLRAL